MKRKLQQFMMGRYGNDNLNRFLLVFVLVLFVVSLFTQKVAMVSQILYFAAIAMLIWCYVRMFSRNIQKRYAQNQKFLTMKIKVTGRFSIWKRHLQQSRDYRFFKCPNCSQKVRVPKGKGKIEITCPSCRTQFIRRS